MSAAPASDPTSQLFIILLFAVAIAVGAAVTYFGIIGVLGGPIP